MFVKHSLDTNFKIAIVGRPNVGKSSIFNRLTGTKKAIVHDLPGVTRDRRYGNGRISNLDFIIVDTPGLEEAENHTLEYRMMQQTEIAIDEADLIMIVVDNKVGIIPDDVFFINWVRKKSKQFFLLVNKCEKTFIPDNAYFKIGAKEIVAYSAEHGLGTSELYDVLSGYINDYNAALNNEDNESYNTSNNETINIAIIGKPNAGKSTLINTILEEDRLLTGPESGITRDSIDTDLKYNNYNLKLVDTAGLRKKANIVQSLEKLAAGSSIRSLMFANIVVLMMDASEPLVSQDLAIANLAYDEGRALILAINKFDLVKDKKKYENDLNYLINKTLPQAKGIRLLFISALAAKAKEEVLNACIACYKKWNYRISTNKLNNWLEQVTQAHPLPLLKNGRRVRIKYITQIKTRPPTFKLFSNQPDSIPDSYKRFLQNDLRNFFDMPGVPLRFEYSKSANPFS